MQLLAPPGAGASLDVRAELTPLTRQPNHPPPTPPRARTLGAPDASALFGLGVQGPQTDATSNGNGLYLVGKCAAALGGTPALRFLAGEVREEVCPQPPSPVCSPSPVWPAHQSWTPIPRPPTQLHHDSIQKQPILDLAPI